MIVDRAIYVDGRRTEAPGPFEQTYEDCRRQGGMAWIGLYKPSAEEFVAVAGEFELHALAVEDAVEAHQRPKVEHYGNSIFVVLKTARYLDESETVEFGELHLFLGADFVITVRHSEAPVLAEVRRELEGEPEKLRRGPMAVLHAIMDRVVDGYGPVVDGLGNDIDEIETEVFGGNAGVSRRIYELSREVIQFQRATKPLAGGLERLLDEEDLDSEAKRYLRGVLDDVLRVAEQVDGFRELLTNVLNLNLTLVGIGQSDQTKKISAWAAILVVPTLVTGVYGMNFRYMPELSWTFGYPFSLLLMLGICVVLYLLFKRSGWL